MIFSPFGVVVMHQYMKNTDGNSFQYDFIDENGEIQTDTVYITIVPRTITDRGVFVVYSAKKNGTMQNYVRRANIQTGAEADAYIKIVFGLAPSDKIVTGSSGELYDGCEAAIFECVQA